MERDNLRLRESDLRESELREDLRESELRDEDRLRERDRNESAETRSERFIDTGNEKLLTSGNLSHLNCFFKGDIVANRMAAIRKSIYNIRTGWEQFDRYMINLKDYMENESKASGGLSESVKGIFERKRNWIDLEPYTEKFESIKDEFNVIYSYTSKQGYKEIFKFHNRIFRDDSTVNYDDVIENAVFLTELINIDLFNLVYKYPELSKFEGVVYRGMVIEQSDFTVFDTLLQQPINKRYISIPLGLWSSTTLLENAMKFVKKELKKNLKGVPLLMKIHVLNTDEEYLQFYRKRYGNRSVVSTICAVPIQTVSRYPDEREVILRGGFYQALRLFNCRINDLDCKVLELVMLNSNRDHLSTGSMLNEKEDAEARVLFGTSVGVTRNRFIVKFCKENELLDDFEKYEVILREGEEKLKKLMSVE